MTEVARFLRKMWRRMFVLPRRGDGGWRWFVLYWSWSLAGVLPGAIIAAFIIGHQRIGNETQQNVIAVSLAFAGALCIQVLMSAWMVLLANALASPFTRPVAAVVDEGSKITAFLVTLSVPFLIAGAAAFLYFTYPSGSVDAGARGAAGAVLLKTLLSLVWTVLFPEVTGFATGSVKAKILQWLRSEDTTPRGA